MLFTRLAYSCFLIHTWTRENKMKHITLDRIARETARAITNDTVYENRVRIIYMALVAAAATEEALRIHSAVRKAVKDEIEKE